MPVENYNSNDLGHEFYKFLSANYLLKTHPEFDADMEWEIKEQANVQVNFAERMLYLFKTKDPVFFKLCMNLDSRAPAEHKTFKKERKWIPFALLVNRTLPQYETLKRCLLFALDSDKLGLKKTSITYGQIINQLQHQHGMELRIVKALDNELRNIIAHGSWYVKEGKFVYLNKEQTHDMSYEDLKTRTSNFYNFTKGFFTSYWGKYVRLEHTMLALIKKNDEILQDVPGDF